MRVVIGLGKRSFHPKHRVMKTKFILLVALMLCGSFALAQVLPVSPLRLTSFSRAGALKWTNDICTTLPVYEVLRANSPTGTWQHFFSVTNVNSTLLTNALGGSAGAVFHKLRWVSDGPVVFNYSFDEGLGFSAVEGQLAVNFAGVGGTLSSPGTLGSWFFQDTGLLFDAPHPLGIGRFYGGGITVTGGTHRVKLTLTPGSENFYLQGTMQLTVINGVSSYTGLSGLVYQCGFAGCDPIGSFNATRVP